MILLQRLERKLFSSKVITRTTKTNINTECRKLSLLKGKLWDFDVANTALLETFFGCDVKYKAENMLLSVKFMKSRCMEENV